MLFLTFIVAILNNMYNIIYEGDDLAWTTIFC